LVGLDSCLPLGKGSDGLPDPDFLGRQPASSVLPALEAFASWPRDLFVSHVKYLKDWPLAKFLRNPMPKQPSTMTSYPTEPFFKGEWGRWLTRMANFPSDRPESPSVYRFLFSWSQSKRGFDPVPTSFVRKAYQDHADQMSKPPPTDLPFDEDELSLFIDVVLHGLPRIKDLATLALEFEASSKASYLTPRNEGGAREEVRLLMAEHIQTVILPYDSTTGITRPSVGHDDLVRMVEVQPGVVAEERGLLPLSPDELRSFVAEVNSRDTASLPLRARVVAITEPLKVRIITAMAGFPTFLARPIQKALWDHLRTLPMFRLIGSPMDQEALRSLSEADRLFRSGPLSRLPKDEQDLLSKLLLWASGDYKGATDGVDIRATLLACDAILAKTLTSEDHALFGPLIRKLLEPNVLQYPVKVAKPTKLPKRDPSEGPRPHQEPENLKEVAQANGQLMGSIMSFNILCILNAYTYFRSLPKSVRDRILIRRIPLRTLPVLINGDDILFRATQSHYDRWLAGISVVGFVPSLGKNFIHDRFLTVNSLPIVSLDDPSRAANPLVHKSLVKALKSYQWSDDQPEDTLLSVISRSPVDTCEILTFLNVGLLLGMSKLTGRSSTRALSLSSLYDGSVMGAMNPPFAHRRVLFYHKDSIQQATRFGSMTLNLFAHPLLGGLGFPVPPGVEPRFSEPQRRLALKLSESAHKTFHGQSRDYPLEAISFTTSPKDDSQVLHEGPKPSSILGYSPSEVVVQLYPYGTPLPKGFSEFLDRSAVHRIPLSGEAPEPPGDQVASCRLTNARLRHLTKGAAHHAVPLMPLDSMTHFPYVPVRYDAWEVVNGVPSIVLPLYSPELPLRDSKFLPPKSWTSVQDYSVEDPEPPPEVLRPDPGSPPSPPLTPAPEAEPEDWESDSVLLVLPHTVLRVDSVPDTPPIPPPARSFATRQRRLDSVLFRSAFHGPSGVPQERPFGYHFSRKGSSKGR
jgi:hypothetical protein